MKFKFILSGLIAWLVIPFAGAADTSISGLPSASALSGSDVAPVTQSGTTKKATAAQIATFVLGSDAEAAAIIGLTSAADRLPYYTGSGTASLATFTSFGRSLVDDADAATARTTVGLGNVENTALSTWAGTTNLNTFDLSISPTWSGTHIFSNVITGARFTPTATTVSTTPNVYKVGTNRLGFATNSIAAGEFNATGAFVANVGILSAGTKFTASGCSNSTTVGGSTAGKFTSGTTGTCTVTITLPTATTDWNCTAENATTVANLMVQNDTAAHTTSCTISGTTVTGDIIRFTAIGY
jgi:hypothetical protein